MVSLGWRFACRLLCDWRQQCKNSKFKLDLFFWLVILHCFLCIHKWHHSWMKTCQISLLQLPWRGIYGLVVTPPRLRPCAVRVKVYLPFLFPTQRHGGKSHPCFCHVLGSWQSLGWTQISYAKWYSPCCAASCIGCGGNRPLVYSTQLLTLQSTQGMEYSCWIYVYAFFSLL